MVRGVVIAACLVVLSATAQAGPVARPASPGTLVLPAQAQPLPRFGGQQNLAPRAQPPRPGQQFRQRDGGGFIARGLLALPGIQGEGRHRRSASARGNAAEPTHARRLSRLVDDRPNHDKRRSGSHQRRISAQADGDVTHRKAASSHSRRVSAADNPAKPTHNRRISLAVAAGDLCENRGGVWRKGRCHRRWQSIGVGVGPRPRPLPAVVAEPATPEFTPKRPAAVDPPKPPRQPPAAPRSQPPRLAAPLPAPVERPQFRPRDIIVAISSAPDARIGLMRDYNLQATPERDIALIEARIVRLSLLDNRPLDGVIEQLQADPRVISVQPNYIYGVDGDDMAALAQAQYNLAALNVPAAHRLSTGRDVRVAVIDTCVDGAHPALKTAITASFDATGQTSASCEAAEHHGTSVAGLIAARGSIQGVAPGASVLAARAFSAAEGAAVEGTTETLLIAMDWAIGQKAQVLNLSFTGPRDPLVERAVTAALKKGALLVAAAGNKGPNAQPLYPAAYPQVIAVSAIDAKNEVYAQANRGAHVAIAAPGVDVLTLRPKGGYDFGSGTSYAAAHIAGVAALLMEQNPDLDPAALRDLIAATANDLGDAGLDDVFGAGLANAEAAVMRNDTAAAAKISAAAK